MDTVWASLIVLEYRGGTICYLTYTSVKQHQKVKNYFVLEKSLFVVITEYSSWNKDIYTSTLLRVKICTVTLVLSAIIAND